MSGFNIYDAMLKWYKTGTVIPDRHREEIDKLVEEMLSEAVKKYIKENITIEESNMYWDKMLSEYVEPDEIIDSAAFDMWDEKWYPKKIRKLNSLLEGSEVENFLEDLSSITEYHIINLKRKLF